VIPKSAPLKESLYVGLVQTNLDAGSACAACPEWKSLSKRRPGRKSGGRSEASRLQLPKPDLILLPELSVPQGRIGNLRRMASSLGSIVVAGVDYRLDWQQKHASMKRWVIIPGAWRDNSRRHHQSPITVGKTYPAPKEKKDLATLGWSFQGHPTLWLFRADDIGKFRGVDLFTTSWTWTGLSSTKGGSTTSSSSPTHGCRVVPVPRRIAVSHHVLYVVICNTGFYGGSVAVSAVLRAVAKNHLPARR